MRINHQENGKMYYFSGHSEAMHTHHSEAGMEKFKTEIKGFSKENLKDRIRLKLKFCQAKTNKMLFSHIFFPFSILFFNFPFQNKHFHIFIGKMRSLVFPGKQESGIESYLI